MDTSQTSNKIVQHAFTDQLQQLRDGTLDAEARGRVKAHLRRCADCQQRYAAVQATPADTVMVSPLPRPPDYLLQRLGILTHDGGFDIARLQALAQQNISWARVELERIQLKFRAALVLWLLAQPRRRVKGVGKRGADLDRSLPSLGPEDDWPQHQDATVVEATGRKQHSLVRVTIVQPPIIQPNGELVCILWTDDAQVSGGTVQCTVTAVENIKVTFSGRFQLLLNQRGWVAVVKATDLLSQGKPVEIPPEQISLTVHRKASEEAATHSENTFSSVLSATESREESESALRVRLWVESANPTTPPLQLGARDQGIDPSRSVSVFTVGDLVRIGVSVSQDAYVYLFDVNPEGTVTQIMPSAEWPEHILRGGQDVFLPPKGYAVGLPVEEPSGVETLIVVASVVPVQIHVNDVMQLSQALASGVRGSWALAHEQWLVVR